MPPMVRTVSEKLLSILTIVGREGFARFRIEPQLLGAIEPDLRQRFVCCDTFAVRVGDAQLISRFAVTANRRA